MDAASAFRPVRYIHVLKKSLIINRYKVIRFHKNDGKVNDYRCANAHSYKQACKSAAIFVYDKTAQLKMITKYPQSLIRKNVLRLEIQNRRKAMKKIVKEEDMDNNWKIVHKLFDSAGSIFGMYLKRMKLDIGISYRYEDAVRIVTDNTKKERREQMIFLLRKTSDCGNLSAAVNALREEYGLNSRKVDRLFKKFKKLCVSPITLPNNCKIRGIQNIASLLT